MNKIIQELIREMIEGLVISENDESENDKSEKGSYLSIRNISKPPGPMTDSDFVVRQLSDNSTGTKETSGQKEVQLFMSDEYDRFSSIFPQIKSDPYYFSIGSSISINRNEIILNSGNNKSVEVMIQQKENKFPGTVNLKTYGSFHKGISIKHSDDVIELGYKSVMDPPGNSASIASTILTKDPKPAATLSKPNNTSSKSLIELDQNQLTNLSNFIESFENVNGYDTLRARSYIGYTSESPQFTLKEIVKKWVDWTTNNRLLWMINQNSISKLRSSFEYIYNTLEDITLSNGLIITTIKNSNTFRKNIKKLQDLYNSMSSGQEKVTLSNFLRYIGFYSDPSRYKGVEVIKNNFKISENSEPIPNQILEWVNEQLKINKSMQAVKPSIPDEEQELYKKQLKDYNEEKRELSVYYKNKYSPENVVQTSTSAEKKSSKTTRLSDAMLQFAHAAKGKVVSDLDVDAKFSEDIINVNVLQFSKLLKDFKPEIVIIPGSSSKFNTDYFERIKKEVNVLNIEIKDYSSFKSTHIVDYDVDDGLMDAISQNTRDSDAGTPYRTEFWQKSPDDAKKYYITSIHMGSSDDKYYSDVTLSKDTKVKIHYLLKETIAKYSTDPDITASYGKVLKNISNIDGEATKIMSFNNSDFDIIDVLGYLNPEIVLFSINNFPDINPKEINIDKLEIARNEVINSMNQDIEFFIKNGHTKKLNVLHTEKIADDIKSSRTERLKRMVKQIIGSEYVIDKQTKTSKTISEMGALKISELGSLGGANQTKRIFMKDMHLLIDLKKIPSNIRNNIIDILNGFASAAYNAFQGNIIDFASEHTKAIVDKANELVTDPENIIKDPGSEIGNIMQLLIDGIKEIKNNPMSIMSPSLPSVMKDFIASYNSFITDTNYDNESRNLLEKIYEFIVIDYRNRAIDIQDYIDTADKSFESFVKLYKEKIFSIISVKGDELSDSNEIIEKIIDITKNELSAIDATYDFNIDDITPPPPGPYDTAIEEINKIISFSEKHSAIEEINEYFEIIKDPNTDDYDKDAAIELIKEILNEPSEENSVLKSELFSLNAELDLQDMIEKSKNVNDDNKELQIELQKELQRIQFFEKSIATILYGFAKKICLEGIRNQNNKDSKFDLEKMLIQDASFLTAINSQIAKECLSEVTVNGEKIIVYPFLDLRSNTIIFSSKTQTNVNLSFTIDFNLVDFIHSRIDQTNKILSAVYTDFDYYGFKRPRRILMIDDNVSSGGTYAMIAKSILELQQKEGCYFKFEKKNTTSRVPTQFFGDVKNFDLKDVKPTNDVCLSHIIGLTPIFI